MSGCLCVCLSVCPYVFICVCVCACRLALSCSCASVASVASMATTGAEKHASPETSEEAHPPKRQKAPSDVERSTGTAQQLPQQSTPAAGDAKQSPEQAIACYHSEQNGAGQPVPIIEVAFENDKWWPIPAAKSAEVHQQLLLHTQI